MGAGCSRFDDKIVLVTGGTSGMGLAAARRFLAEGARVIIVGRDKTRQDAAIADLDGGDRVQAITADVARLADLDSLTSTIRGRYGRLDVVFANAGVPAFAPTPDITEAEFDRVVGINFKGIFFTIQKTLPLLTEHAAIVINAAWNVHRGAADTALYSATKAAVHNLVRSLAAELAPNGIRVNSVSPGYIGTPAYKNNVSAEIQAAAGAAVAAGRIGSADEVAAAVAFLASSDATYIAGADLLVDGGFVTVRPKDSA